MAALPRDKILLGGAVLAALGSCAIFGILTVRGPAAPRGPLPPLQLASEPYTPTAVDAPPVKTAAWEPPAAQSRGREWIYDTFTPPEIFYNARTRQFTVRPPSSLLEDQPQEPFGLELIAVQPEPFRLQLIGYVGGEGNWRGTFQNVLTGEVFLGAAGRTVPSLALTIESFDVKPRPILVPDSMTTFQRVATAVIRDERNGRSVTLTHRERVFTDAVSALVAPSGEPAMREVRPGDVFNLGDATYRVEKIQLEPPSAEILKQSAGAASPVRSTLTPRDDSAADAPEPVRGRNS